MRLLLDTEVWLWSNFDRRRILPAALEAMQEAENERFISLVSYWEISIKHGLGKLRLPEPLETFLPTRLATAAATRLDISASHVVAVSGLPHIHRDPFDRLLVAQARIEGLTLVTADPDVARYKFDVLWAHRRNRQPRRPETTP